MHFGSYSHHALELPNWGKLNEHEVYSHPEIVERICGWFIISYSFTLIHRISNQDNQKDKEVTKSPTKRTNLEPENQDNLKDKKTTVSPPKMAKLEPLNADIPDSVADELDEEELEIDQVADSDIDSDQNDGGSFMSSDKSESSRTSSPLPMPSSLHRLSSDATTTKRAAAAR